VSRKMILIKHNFSCGPHILADVGYTLPTLLHKTMDLVISLITLHTLVVTPDEHCGLQHGGRDVWIPLSAALEHAVLMPEHSIDELAHTVDWDTLRPVSCDAARVRARRAWDVEHGI
jgi:hypothetical protein